MDPALRELLETNPDERVEAVIRLDGNGGVPPGVEIVARFGDVATCRVARELVGEVWSDADVVSLKAARVFGPDPDIGSSLEGESGDELHSFRETGPVASDVRRPDGLPADGRGVIVAAVDWGFDFLHPNLIGDDGTSRILALWDQTAPGAGVEPYGYGRVFEKEDIDAALQSRDPYAALGYHPASGDPAGRGAHGTHVIDIAAGNGRAPGSPTGVAPGADLLLVHLAARGTGGRANLGDSVTLLEALDWIRNRAGERPFVCNLSVGRHGGPHNGLTLVERGIDALLTEAPGRCVVQSTGNYYGANVHACGQLRPGQTHVLHWVIDESDVTPNELEIWYARHDTMRVELQGPEDLPRISVTPGDDDRIERGGEKLAHVYHRANDPATGDTHIDIFLYRAAPPGTWVVSLIGEDVVDGRYHAWVERDAACPGCQSRLAPDEATPRSTTGTVCNGFRSVVVGAHSAHEPARPLAHFSSSGPTTDGRSKPDLLAPGVRVLAARSATRGEPASGGRLTRMSGTSMAAPHVTGTIACMFEAAGRPLSIQETRVILLSAAESWNRDAPAEDRVRAGSGYLDVEQAVLAAASVRPSALAETSDMEIAMSHPLAGALCACGSGAREQAEEFPCQGEGIGQAGVAELIEDLTAYREPPGAGAVEQAHDDVASPGSEPAWEAPPQWNFTPKVEVWMDGVAADPGANESLMLYVRFHPQPRLAIVNYLRRIQKKQPWAKDVLEEIKSAADLNALLDEIALWLRVTNFEHSKEDAAFGVRFAAEKALRDDLWDAVQRIASWRRVRAYQAKAVLEKDLWRLGRIGRAFADDLLKSAFPRLYRRIKLSEVPSAIYDYIGWHFLAAGEERLKSDPRFQHIVKATAR
ncbi:MAG TPA: S8 family serine peptidase [Candidatus Krumholzibacteria bacterium]|nr:S8 family serine peptidase [Candidatus Krumholzibacteria bacterium]